MDVTNVEEFVKEQGYSGWELPEEFKILDHILLSHGRWTIFCLDVIADKDGHVFGIVYDIPATEQQEGSEGYVRITPVTTIEGWAMA